ncbi:hypothetical protein BH23VER1_BH23VER1_14610 [soil metagenome]
MLFLPAVSRLTLIAAALPGLALGYFIAQSSKAPPDEPPDRITAEPATPPPPPDSARPEPDIPDTAELDRIHATAPDNWRTYIAPIQEIARQSPDAAVAWIATNVDTNGQPTLLSRILIEPLAVRDAAAAVRLVRDVASLEPRTVELALGFSIDHVPVGQFEAFADGVALIADDETRRDVLAQTLDSWAQAAPATAVEWIRRNDVSDPAVITAALTGATRSRAEFDRASDLLERLSPAEVSRAVGSVANSSPLARSDAASMFRLFTDIGQIGELPERVYNWATYDPEAAGAAALGITDDGIRREALDRLAAAWTEHEPVRAKAWLEAHGK